MATKRSYKLQEFVAHSSNVNCLKIGPKSGRVLATGGEDRKVNIWAIGKPNVIMSLTGHNSPVDCVGFDQEEHYVVAGSSGGSLRLWDLNEAKVVRYFSGHKSNCISVDFHPYGDFFASGSMDTNLKVWDIRRKGCIFTHKGHTQSINAIKFSPDGRWVVSTSEDGTAKIWDLTNGKLLRDLTQHTSAVTSVDFHPNEFIMATGSADKTVKIWDLETFDMISSSDLDTTRIRGVKFTPDGSCVLSATSENLKVQGWEPSICYDTVALNWGNVQDLGITKDQVVACSVQQSFVSVWVANLQRLAPFCVGEEEGNGSQNPGYEQAANRAVGSHSRQAQASHNWDGVDQSTLASMKKMQISPEEQPPALQAQTSQPTISQPTALQQHAQRRRDSSRPSSSQDQVRSRPSSVEPRQSNMISPSLERPSEDRKDYAENPVVVRDAYVRPPPQYGNPPPNAGRRNSSAGSNRPNSRNSNQEKPAALEYFQRGLDAPKQCEPVFLDENSIVETVMSAHDAMCQILRQRLFHVQNVRVLWTKGDVRGSIDALLKQKDPAVIPRALFFLFDSLK
eukprot:TRINITY_DN3785_c0_g1_i4.p1 TRINITY_DN3785_c0_g1~~TRINITY_DN3785_c0_g1_i4.p1  ORF type:complete len:565 (+),score=84.83 TRINITY_DN3785_c0_g1_i4:100-1794(+)